MGPRESCNQALGLLEKGDLQNAVEIVEGVLAENREFGDAYAIHARAFLMAGDASQPLIDLDAAEWAIREYGQKEQLNEVHALRVVTYTIRTLWGGQNDAQKCQKAVQDWISDTHPIDTLFFLPAVCWEQMFKKSNAEKWVKEMGLLKPLKPTADKYFEKGSRFTSMIGKVEADAAKLPVYLARYVRARFERKTKDMQRAARRISDAKQTGDAWSVLLLYASGETTCERV